MDPMGFGISHDGSMGLAYLPIHELLILTIVNVSKYSSPMDPMGIWNEKDFL